MLLFFLSIFYNLLFFFIFSKQSTKIPANTISTHPIYIVVGRVNFDVLDTHHSLTEWKIKCVSLDAISQAKQ